MASERLCFLTEWFDPHAEVTRKYHLLYFPEDSTVEMIDNKAKRIFLKKTKVTDIGLQDLKLGASVTVLGRQLHVLDYGDEHTRSALAVTLEHAILIVPFTINQSIGKILTVLEQEGFTLEEMRMFPNGDQRSYLLHVSKNNAYDQLKQLLYTEGKQSLYSKVGLTNTPQTMIYASQNTDAAQQDIQKLFSRDNLSKRSALLNEKTTLCIILPHMVLRGIILFLILEGKAGQVLTDILNGGFVITDLQTYCLEKVDAEEFLEVYNGLLTEYSQMVKEFTAGTLIAIELKNGKDTIVTDFRDFVGPRDPELAKEVRPESLRAKYALDSAKTAVHCTELPKDGILETDYFFNLLTR